MQNKLSFVQENAELSYKVNSVFQPFIGGGLLQVVDLDNFSSSADATWIKSLNSPTLDTTGYKFGGGFAVNYKNYALRLEQQYLQRGNYFHSNQSTLTFKLNFG